MVPQAAHGNHVKLCQRHHHRGHDLRNHAGCHALCGCPQTVRQAAHRGHVEFRQRPHRVGHFLLGATRSAPGTRRSRRLPGQDMSSFASAIIVEATFCEIMLGATLCGCPQTVTQAAHGGHVKFRQSPHHVGHVLQIHAGCQALCGC
jgi:hypothetical protein